MDRDTPVRVDGHSMHLGTGKQGTAHCLCNLRLGKPSFALTRIRFPTKFLRRIQPMPPSWLRPDDKKLSEREFAAPRQMRRFSTLVSIFASEEAIRKSFGRRDSLFPTARVFEHFNVGGGAFDIEGAVLTEEAAKITEWRYGLHYLSFA
jgi:hypothetical protein